MLNRVLLNVKRYVQKPGECAVASTASIINFFDQEIHYRDLRKMSKDLLSDYVEGEGLYTSQQCQLLNAFGFDKVTVVTSDLNLVDFSWNQLSKSKLLGRMKKLSAYYGRSGDPSKCVVRSMIEWLGDNRYKNRLIVDNDYSKYIRRSLNKGCPVGASVNWTKMFKASKGDITWDGDIKGEEEDHAVVIRGYDQEGLFIVDSNRYCVSEKFKNGYYKISWEKFLVNTTGDLILL